jgi:riboflavin kinase/FMN adenylyltransferase
MDSFQRSGIRAELAGVGDRKTSRRLLHAITARGKVVYGAQRGRLLGFPTANVETPLLDLPADGVYAGWYQRANGDRWPCAVNVGTRPTFCENAASTLEAHLIDFDGDLYGEAAIVRLTWFLRAERAFSGVDELVAQLRADVALARCLVAGAPAELSGESALREVGR